MDNQIVEIDMANVGHENPLWIEALEAGKVLYFPNFGTYQNAGFSPIGGEVNLFRDNIRDKKFRNISLSSGGVLRGMIGDSATHAVMASMIERFRMKAQALIGNIAPRYSKYLKEGATSFRPMAVETRHQSWRADDRRMHVDAFPSRPNRGERLLRIFTNVNLAGLPRVWRVGEPFEDVSRHFLPQITPYSRWQSNLLHSLGVTKSFRTEYDHLMLQLHDAMKADLNYQKTSPQVTFNFPSGSAWICFSDQTSHAVMSGQFMMEHTLQLSPDHQYDLSASPLAILTRLQGRALT